MTKELYVIQLAQSGYWQGKFLSERDPSGDGWGPQHLPTDDLSCAKLFSSRDAARDFLRSGFHNLGETRGSTFLKVRITYEVVP